LEELQEAVAIKATREYQKGNASHLVVNAKQRSIGYSWAPRGTYYEADI
jgi:hypothetical protein